MEPGGFVQSLGAMHSLIVKLDVAANISLAGCHICRPLSPEALGGSSRHRWFKYFSDYFN